jgi:pantoate--beta-alanine ligase
MSSRNAYLSPEERAAATVLHGALSAAKKHLASGERDVLQLQSKLRSVLDAEPLVKIDYVEIVDADSFEPVVSVNRPSYVLLAVYLGKTRLIDNMLVEPAESASDTFIFNL